MAANEARIKSDNSTKCYDHIGQTYSILTVLENLWGDQL